MSAAKVNTFLQRMLRRNSFEELNGPENLEGRSRTEPEKPVNLRGNWMKKLGNCSPSKYQISPARTNALKGLNRSEMRDASESPRKGRFSGSPSSPLEMPDLESIIREFETGFLSPTKHDSSCDGSKQKNFVKKIVAAFEVKYKTYNDLKIAQESNSEETRLNYPEPFGRRSGIFGSPFKNNPEESGSNKNRHFDDCSSKNKSRNNPDGFKRISGIFGSPFKLSFDEDADSDYSSKMMDEDSKDGSGRSGIFSSPYSKDISGGSSEIYASPLRPDRQDSKDSSSDCSSLFRFDEESSSRGTNFIFSPFKGSSLDDTKPMDGIDLDVTLPEPVETIFLEGNGLPKTSTMIQEFSIEDDRGTSLPDKTPKIVGAFLKKPIEVEDTSIDWIPITGKKLPRKRSLKKLLYSLTGRRHEKKNKLYSSERNLNDETKELQDSGYDERSCSSSSLTSLVSITEVLLQQENSYVEPGRRTAALRTFGSRNSLEEEEDEAFYDTYRATSKHSKRRLLLTEMPRDQVKLDLGPYYPSPTKIVTMSLDRRTTTKRSNPLPTRIATPLTRIPKHPHLSNVPKHPFISLTKMDESPEFVPEKNKSEDACKNKATSSSNPELSLIVKNDLYEVEFRQSSRSLSDRSSTSNYDVPRRFLSKSENELPTACESVVLRRQREPIYDVPRRPIVERPRSSVFEEALSLKRRSTHLAESLPFSMYEIPRELDCHYATVKPRNTRVCFNNDLLRSYTDISNTDARSAF